MKDDATYTNYYGPPTMQFGLWNLWSQLRALFGLKSAIRNHEITLLDARKLLPTYAEVRFIQRICACLQCLHASSGPFLVRRSL